MKTRPAPKLFDVVELLTAHARLPAGTVGTVVEELSNDHVLVEFVGTDGNAPSVHTVALASLVLRP